MIRDTRPGRPPGLLLVLALALATLPAAAAPPRPLAARLPEAVAEAQRLVERVRGVPFRGTVASALLPEKDLTAVLDRKLVEDLPAPFERYAASLSALGLIEPTPELQKRLTRLYARQVIGFYDPSEKKFYVVPERAGEVSGAAPGLGVTTGDLVEEALLTHELTHALQDRRLDLDKRMKALKESTDSLLALEAFLEGEATVVMTEALLSRLPADARATLGGNALSQMMSGLAGPGSAPVEGSEGLPDFFVKELLFPYVWGTAWIEAQRAAGGWEAVDEAYRRLPETTSEILHPDRSFASRARLSHADRPSAKEVPAGSKPLYADTLGEWVLKVLLERAGAGESAASLAAERQDDRILFFEKSEGPGPRGGIGFVWRIRVTGPAVAHRLAEALRPLYAGRPAVARPAIQATGDVVEVVRGKPVPAEEPATRPATSPPEASTPSAGR